MSNVHPVSRPSLAPTSADDGAVLRARSRALAARRLDDERRASLGVFVVVRRGSSRLALPVDRCHEVRRVTVFSAPGCDAVVVGLFQVRARVLTMVDLAGLASAGEPIAHGASSLVAVVHSDHRELGLLIDEVEGARELFCDEVNLDLDPGGAGFVSAVTRDLAQILDVDALLASPVVACARRPGHGREGR